MDHYKGVCKLQESGDNLWLWDLQMNDFATSIRANAILHGIEERPFPNLPGPAKQRHYGEGRQAVLQYKETAESVSALEDWDVKHAKLSLVISNTCPVSLLKSLGHVNKAAERYKFIKGQISAKRWENTLQEYNSIGFKHHRSPQGFTKSFGALLLEMDGNDSFDIISNEDRIDHFATAAKQAFGHVLASVTKEELVAAVEANFEKLLNEFKAEGLDVHCDELETEVFVRALGRALHDKLPMDYYL